MNYPVKQWLPIILCCLPGLGLIAIVGFSSAALGAAVNGPLGVGLLTLALLACPLSMVWMTWRGRLHQRTAGDSIVHDATGTAAHAPMMACCLPSQTTAVALSEAPGDRLAALRERRIALEREVVDLQSP